MVALRCAICKQVFEIIEDHKANGADQMLGNVGVILGEMKWLKPENSRNGSSTNLANDGRRSIAQGFGLGLKSFLLFLQAALYIDIR
jgi:hypothetical protein